MKWLISLLATFVIGFPQFGYSETLEEKGLWVAQQMERRDDGWGHQYAEETIVQKEKDGGETIYKIRLYMEEVPGDGDKVIAIFDEPHDVQGMASLVFTHRHQTIDMWSYFPNIRRVKRVSSQNKTSSFLGTEFTNEDFVRGEVERYTYRWIKDETYEGMPCWVIDRFPKEDHSGYTRQRFWIDKKEKRLLKGEFYDLEDQHIKTLYFKKYQKYLDYFWRQGEMIMVNEKTGRKTRAIFENWNLKVDLRKNLFTPNGLRNIR